MERDGVGVSQDGGWGRRCFSGARRLADGRTLETPLLEQLSPVFGSFGAVKLIGDLRGYG